MEKLKETFTLEKEGLVKKIEESRQLNASRGGANGRAPGRYRDLIFHFFIIFKFLQIKKP